MTSSGARWRNGAVLVAISALLCVLALYARPLDLAAHGQTVAQLGELNELDSEIDELVLELRYGMLGNYDHLNSVVAKMKSLARGLHVNGLPHAVRGDPALERELQELDSAVSQKEMLVEDFKTRNALVANSLRYLTLAVDTATRALHPADPTRGQMLRLQRDILFLHLTRSGDDRRSVSNALDLLRADHSRKATVRQHFDKVIEHAAYAVRVEAEIDALVVQVASGTSKHLGSDLAAAYNQAFEHELKAANLYKVLLTLLLLGLIAFAAHAFMRLRRSKTQLAGSEERYRKLFELSPDGMLIHSEGKIVLVNSMCMKMLGASVPEELIGKPVLDIYHSDSREHARERMRQVHEENRSVPALERKIVMLDGAAVDVELAASPITHRGKPSDLVVMRDITERKAANERLNYLAQYDSLTGLPNRSLFRDRLEHTLAQAKRSGRSAAVLFIDLDRFKMVNDTLGHAVGDKLLKQVAVRLSACIRTGDTVGRFGGDEFSVILLDLAKPSDAAVVAQKINDTLARPFDLDGHRTFVAASIGITLYPTDATDPETLQMNADAAMYLAKELGRNTYRFFTQEMNDRAMQRMEMEASMRQALERGEFLLHYQPKVDLASGAICGMEALLRWAHPQKGMVYPAEFIPVLEETGLIVPVGDWVVREACRQIGAWQRAGVKVPHVAVNLSARQFQQKNLEDIVCDILRETGVAPDLLQFEITESMLMNDPKAAAHTLLGLRKAGVMLSVDDFGTGYSSLAYLKRFPLDALKIDRSFVIDMTSGSQGLALVSTIISLAHSLKLKVVAEGVETEEQSGTLRLLNCDQMQGYYFSKPVAAAALETMLREGRRLTHSQDLAQAGPAVLAA